MIRVLGVHENLESKRKALEDAMGRPAFVMSFPCAVDSETRFREPTEDDYRVRGRLELMLKQWDMGSCVERIDYEEYKVRRDGQTKIVPAHTIRKFDLKPATVLFLACPRREGEPHDIAIDYSKVTGLGVGQSVLVDVNDHDNAMIPIDLVPFTKWMKRRMGGPKRRTMDFYMSEGFFRPSHVEPNWHVGYIEPNHTHKHWKTGEVIEFAHSGGSMIQAPGCYPLAGYVAGPGEPWNQKIACTRKPGECVVCHGASGEWRHLGNTTFGPDGVYATGLVCKTCLPQAFAQWLQIVGNLSLTAGDVKPKTGDCCDKMRAQVGNGFSVPQLVCPFCGVQQ
jgi:hypothetical protein